MNMKLSELITALADAMIQNGDMTVNLCVDGNIYQEIEINCVDDILYVEGYDKI